ncbi:MAG: hypothetical protein A3F84_05555 [Candidatus Handelsmanbacteria bacterium RIFCSPLOWO2_12_FULL_64_10]|uniref:O-antigen ligase-related domain-containing protein n=1 Tax=Handelsmanbacteria sp. (strain RIFCSPLOWO2_12_FULL_64_10) TaxID=1817868 RepID=A0A1F6C622_HANXR|nr:MAG: hypothetical protein A3F84_05555 [Candidatus Handelsmanbacteria bacterium RIFCSPLOWO2_12_FULL_64_10]
MKYAAFIVAFALGVPAVSFAAASSARLRGWLLAALIFSTALGDVANIYFLFTRYRGPDRGFEVNLTDLIAWGMIIALLLRYPTKICWVPYNSSWMFVFFGIACASAWGAPDRLLASFSLFKLVRMYALFWCVVNCLRVGTRLEYVWTGLVAIGAFMTALVVKQKYLDGIVRVPGPFDHSNTVTSFLNLILPVVLVWGLCDRRLTRGRALASLAAAFGSVFAVVSTLSRAGLVLAAGCMMGALGIANLRARSVRVTATSLVVCLGMLAGGLKSADTLFERFRGAPEESALARKEFEAAAAWMVNDRPLQGVGLNNFSYVLTIPSKYRENFKTMAGERQAGVAHHIYLLTAAEMGYPGLIVFVILIGRFAWLAGRHAWGARSLEALLLFGFFLGLCALYAVGFLEWTLRITPVSYLFIISCGICVALAEAVRQRRELDRAASAQRPYRTASTRVRPEAAASPSLSP